MSQAVDQLLHDPAWNTVALGGIDEAKENKMAQEHPPVRPKAAQ